IGCSRITPSCSPTPATLAHTASGPAQPHGLAVGPVNSRVVFGLQMLPIAKLEAVQRRFQELEHLMCSPAVLAAPAELQRLNRERSEIEPVVATFTRLRDVERRIAEDREALNDPE